MGYFLSWYSEPELSMNMLQLYTANFLYNFNPFKMAVQFFLAALNFSNFDGPNAFFPKFNKPMASTSER